MSTATLGLIIIILVALAFDYTNGFHDSANAIATTISTKALTPRAALGLAAIMNVVGALVSTKVAATVGAGIIAAPVGRGGLVVVFSALLGAITWNLLTWYFGLPSSSSHALIGGLVGAAIAASRSVQWSGVFDKVVVPMVLSPLVGFGLAYLAMVGVLWAFRKANPHRANRGFRHAQIGSAALMAFGHGTQDAQKTMGVITLALVTSGHLTAFHVPLWVILASAAAISAGTYSGGWRIMRTMGRRIIHLTPADGVTAQSVASAVMLGTAYVYAVPVSTTHVITSSVMGVGATRRLSAVRWGVARSIGAAWVLTIPAAAVAAALVYLVSAAILGS
ncbi:MAG TPA: inorganic phosphate transporter [Mycobacteriales bacterium]|nr:inorganic phosphate transporter [Mycobacteriales bacterium]